MLRGRCVILSVTPALRELFESLLELGPADRERRLRDWSLPDTLTARLQAMLAAESVPQVLLETPVACVVSQWCDDRSPTNLLISSRIGPFHLQSLIGEGGSSVVFRAERALGRGDQVVALKLLRNGLYSADAQRRFAREQAILAQLNHPNIARLIEGGLSDSGVPYLAMDYVDGEPITHYADAHALSLRQRIELMLSLSRAIEAAHAALVVHRDLKPSNVHVDQSGAIKVLDFGIAKLIDGADSSTTRTQAIMLTPEYAAPEQFQPGPITTAADVYSLGVLMGELLTGVLLGRNDTHNASTAVVGNRDRPMPRGLPGRKLLARQLRGDIDSIVATALAEDPARRYRSAGALADDIERYLAGQPVGAHSPSR